MDQLGACLVDLLFVPLLAWVVEVTSLLEREGAEQDQRVVRQLKANTCMMIGDIRIWEHSCIS